MNILGLSAYYHDSAACLVVDGEIVAAAQEERFTRKKHDAGFPAHAIDYCLSQGGLKPADVDHVVFYDKPFLKFERLFETYLAEGEPAGLTFQQWVESPAFDPDAIAAGFKPTGWGHALSDWVLRRE